MQMASIVASVMRMSRIDLESAHIEAGVAKWGKGERGGLEKQAAKKTMATLRLDHMVRLAEAAGVPESEIRSGLPDFSDGTQCLPALGALDDGPS
jgi:hypothetical protein